MDVSGTKRRCVNPNTCIYTLKQLYYGDLCIDREQWLNKNPRNYVYFLSRARTYKGNLPMKVEDVCVVYDYNTKTPVDNAAFISDRTCGCPSDNEATKYTNAIWISCYGVSESDRKNIIEYELTYKYRGKRVTTYYKFANGFCETLGG